jgi:hypothetical protein
MIAAGVAIFLLLMADIELNDGRYSGTLLRAIESLLGR